MRSLVVLSVVLVVLVSHGLASQTLPDKYFGKFDLDHSENFDEYLTAKGYSWFTRKLITFATFKKEFKKGSKPGTFDYDNLTSKKDVHYKDITLGQEFIGEGLDSTKHKVTFDLKDGKLYEKHVPQEAGEAKEETYVYYFDGDFLVVEMEAVADGKTIVGKRFYKQVSSF